MIDKQKAWDAMISAGKAFLLSAMVFLLAIIAYFSATKNETITIQPTPVVLPFVAPVTPVTPEPTLEPTIAPEAPAAPIKVTTVIVEDENHDRVHPDKANTIANLAEFDIGTYYYIGYPTEGSPRRLTITISDGQTPRPPPKPDTTPTDPPVVAPNVPAGLRVIFVYETEDNLSKEQSDIIMDGDIRDALKAKCSKSKDEKGRDSVDARFWDRQPTLTSEFPLFKDLWSAAEPMLSPYNASIPVVEMIVFNGDKGEIHTVKNKAEVLAILNK